MTRNYILLCLFGISVCFVARSAAILEGWNAQPGTLKYQVSLKIKGIHTCGGCIIGDNFHHILTAAECVIDKETKQFYPINSITVVAGTYSLLKDPNNKTTRVRKIFVPKEYPKESQATASHKTGNIAVIKVEDPLSKFIRMDIPRRNEKFDDKKAKISGFGWNWVTWGISGTSSNSRLVTRIRGDNTDGRLRFANARVLNDTFGQQLLADVGPDIRINDPKLIYAKMMPIHRNIDQRYGACFEDNGGPLVYKTKVIGVLISTYMRCHESLVPGIYARVSSYKDFIEDAMNNQNLHSMHVHPPP